MACHTVITLLIYFLKATISAFPLNRYYIYFAVIFLLVSIDHSLSSRLRVLHLNDKMLTNACEEPVEACLIKKKKSARDKAVPSSKKLVSPINYRATQS